MTRYIFDVEYVRDKDSGIFEYRAFIVNSWRHRDLTGGFFVFEHEYSTQYLRYMKTGQLPDIVGPWRKSALLAIAALCELLDEKEEQDGT